LKCDLPGAAEVRLGAGAVIDPGVLLGYPSGRPGVSGDARIGAGARIRAGSIIYAAVDIGDDFETGHHAVVREENRIGSGARLRGMFRPCVLPICNPGERASLTSRAG